MSTTLTIRNLDPDVKRKLRLQAARHNTSMEAEARAILTRAVEQGDTLEPQVTAEAMRKRLAGVVGLWRDRGTTDELMAVTRGEE